MGCELTCHTQRQLALVGPEEGGTWGNGGDVLTCHTTRWLTGGACGVGWGGGIFLPAMSRGGWLVSLLGRGRGGAYLPHPEVAVWWGLWGGGGCLPATSRGGCVVGLLGREGGCAYVPHPEEAD